MKESKKKQAKPQLLVHILNKQLEALNIGTVECVRLCDNSGYYINISEGSKSICITFDETGNTIERLGVYEDVIEVVSSDLIFGK